MQRTERKKKNRKIYSSVFGQNAFKRKYFQKESFSCKTRLS